MNDSPLQDEVARVLVASGRAPRTVPAVLAALHHLALAGLAPDLAAAYARRDLAAAGPAALETLQRNGEAVASLTRRRRRELPVQRLAALRPLVADLAHRAGAGAVGLVSFAAGPGLDTHLDRVGITCAGRFAGESASPVQVRAGLVRSAAPPPGDLPGVVSRTVLGVGAPGAEDVRWLHACLPPDGPEPHARLDAALGLLAADPPTWRPGDRLDLLDAALADVPDGALPVVTTCWALSELTVEDRARFLRRLDAAATRRAVAWASVEGVGVAPAVPTSGDRPASGHSVLGITLLTRDSLRSWAVGRCWSRGRQLQWLG
nr:DUF2332 family protein [Kineococcus rhizosphaerae]